MDDALAVEVLHHAEKFGENAPAVGSGRISGEPFAKRAAVDVFLYDAWADGRFFLVGEHVREAGMRQAGADFVLPFEALDALRGAVGCLENEALSRYVGKATWKEFCDELKSSSPVESEEFAGESIVSSYLQAGQRLQLGWLPDRLITVQYLGVNRFVVLESLNSSLLPGDSFECLQIQTGRQLYLDRFTRVSSDKESRYVVGDRSGLTLVRLL